MSTAFIMIPGASLPLDRYTKLQSEDIAQLTSIMGEANRATSLPMPFETFERLPHMVWLWQGLSMSKEPPSTAPWLWQSMGAHPIAPELWSLTPLSVVHGDIVECLEFTPEEIPQLLVGLESVLFDEGFRLQVWDQALFASRAEPWPAATMPAMGVLGMSYQDIVTVSECDRHRLLCEKLTEAVNKTGINQVRREKGLPIIDMLFLNGGGTYHRINPPTLTRSVATDNPVVRSWAEAAGIMPEYLTDTSALTWPANTPQGDVIVVLEDLLKPYLLNEMTAWRSALPEVAKKVNAFREAAKAREHESIIVIAGGAQRIVFLTQKKESFMKKLFSGKKPPMSPDIWCPEYTPETHQP